MAAAVGQKTVQVQEDVASALQEEDTGSAEADSDDARAPEAGAWHSVPEASAAVDRARTQAEAQKTVAVAGAVHAPEVRVGEDPGGILEGAGSRTEDMRSEAHSQIEHIGRIDNRFQSQ